LGGSPPSVAAATYGAPGVNRPYQYFQAVIPSGICHVRHGESVLWRIERKSLPAAAGDISSYFYFTEIVRFLISLGITKKHGMT